MRFSNFVTVVGRKTCDMSKVSEFSVTATELSTLKTVSFFWPTMYRLLDSDYHTIILSTIVVMVVVVVLQLYAYCLIAELEVIHCF